MIIQKNLKYFTTTQPAIAIDIYNFRHTQFLDQKHTKYFRISAAIFCKFTLQTGKVCRLKLVFKVEMSILLVA